MAHTMDSNDGGKKKDQQLEQYRVNNRAQKLTTNNGVKLHNTDDSLKVGDRGPTLLEDFHFREKISHFDHERIPERVVHARGFGAYGVFEVYESMSKYTSAKFLQDPAVKTPVFVRFSTVVGSRGSADTVRDVRGFATKFYTEEGNLDIVANNMPVFFIQDAIKFPDMVHSIKPEPHNDLPQATSAHDTFWDFVVNTPELAHMVMWLMSDRAIPQSFRMIEGFGVNTFRFINDKGKARFVKFHWKPLLGVHSLMRDEAQLLCGKDPDFHRRDLWDAIEQGCYPEYEFGVQMLEEDQEFDFDFDILDATKLWPEEVVPVKIIGKMTLNKNVGNFFAETEQVAFCPANLVPGIDFSNDPLLQGRLFSYEDTQLSRLGGPNFREIPVNRPLAAVHNNQRDGMHRMTINPDQVSYFPNSLAHNFPAPATQEEGAFVHYARRVDGHVIRARSESFRDHFSQATLFWNSMSPAEKEHIVDAFHFEVGSSKHAQLRQRVVDLFANVATDLAQKMAQKLGADMPADIQPTGVTAASPALSQANTVMTAKTRKVAILACNGFCMKSVQALMTALHQAGACAHIVSTTLGDITDLEGRAVQPNKDFATAHPTFYDAVYVPGGPEHITALQVCPDARGFINECFHHAKTVGATDEGIALLAATDAADALQSLPGEDAPPQTMQGVITASGAANLPAFCTEYVALLSLHRHWERCMETITQ